MPGQESQEQDIMNVLYEARRMRRSSTTSVHSSSQKVEQVKRIKSKEQLLVEPPKHAKRVTFSKPRLVMQPRQTTVKESESQTGLTSCLITNPGLDPRITGGANNPAERRVGWLARTDSECQFKAPGIEFLTERDTDVVTFEVKMRDSVQSVQDYTTKCDYFPKYVDKRRFKDQTTQTLYRESSAQTLAYLPDITDKEQDEHLEIFNLSTLLAGDKPPGLYEVEILERARKRWAFNKALKTNFQKQLHEERERAIKSKYRPILEAFEWEHWMEREEYIQECQMMRLEIVIRMFDKREKQMHNASKSRIETACETIEQRRQHGLHKNELEYQRAFRRLQIKNAGISRRWVKQSPMYALGSPCSEFYGPLIRHGVDPSRRNFVGDGRKAFDMRIDDLEKRVNMEQLECPFTKLKEWSKPKEYVKEYEQNFCSDKNLQKLYESLKSLRSQATKQKTSPKCLKRRPKPVSDVDRLTYTDDEIDPTDFFGNRRRTDESRAKASLLPEQQLAIQQHLGDEERRHRRPELARELLRERRSEDLEHLLHMYEGSTIGWIMQFLSEEMERLKEQRKLHFFSILTQKERWRREAAEAGLRQKENSMRLLYEDMFQQSNVVHNEITDDYINTILTTDMAHIAECDAAETVVSMAKQIDADIQRWLESFKGVQTPLTYGPLREMLRSMVFPDLSELLLKYEKILIAKYIVEDVLFGRIWDELENYDIASTIASDLIDRLIDNDLYFFSTESESEQPKRNCEREAEAIIRKIIRQAVPGRRWKTETERIIHENCVSLLDDVFNRIMEKIDADLPPVDPVELQLAYSRQAMTPMDDIRHITEEMQTERHERKEIIETDSQVTFLRTQILSLLKKMKVDNVTRDLYTNEQYPGDDAKDATHDTLLKMQVYETVKAQEGPDGEDIFSVISALDLGQEDDFKIYRKSYNHNEHGVLTQRFSSTLTDIGIKFETGGTQTRKEDQIIGALHDFVGDLVGDVEENTEYEADDERSLWNQATGGGEREGEDENENEEEQDFNIYDGNLEGSEEYEEEEEHELQEVRERQEELVLQEELAIQEELVLKENLEEASVEEENLEGDDKQISEKTGSRISLLMPDVTDQLVRSNTSNSYFQGKLGSATKSGMFSNYELQTAAGEDHHPVKTKLSVTRSVLSHRD
ncbi:cilia- and flagella-associated protein 91-like [Drosophila montana]|uniref:cilia- and flagella-associated protein 91-like n=1 Tax=Drosophila montana TaxID=40370 RepID=UPI00313D1C14